MDAREYLKLATEKTEAGDIIDESNLSEAIIKLMEGYAVFKACNISRSDVLMKISNRECVREKHPKDSRCNNCGAKEGEGCNL